jgi:hypothetical protein
VDGVGSIAAEVCLNSQLPTIEVDVAVSATSLLHPKNTVIKATKAIVNKCFIFILFPS